MVTESVREALGSELVKLRLLALPAIGTREQREIERSLHNADRTIGKRLRIMI